MYWMINGKENLHQKKQSIFINSTFLQRLNRQKENLNYRVTSLLRPEIWNFIVASLLNLLNYYDLLKEELEILLRSGIDYRVVSF